MKTKRPKFYILSTGSELSGGRSRDSNGPFLSSALLENGFDIYGMGILPDDADTLYNEIKRVAELPEIDGIIMTGGLGPTEDDLTVDILAKLTGDEIVDDPDSIRKIEVLAKRVKANWNMNAVLRQVRTLKTGQILKNEAGLAPGVLAEYKKSTGEKTALLAAMPGVPQEMAPMFEKRLLPLLQERLGAKTPGKKKRVQFFLYGVGESGFQAEFFGQGRQAKPEGETTTPGLPADKEKLSADFIWGITSARGFIKIFFESNDEEEIQNLNELARTKYKNAYLEKNVLDCIHEYCLRQELKIAFAESCTGGMVGKLLTDAPGSSGYFQGSIVTYANQAKMKLLGVREETLLEHGAVSEECVREMVRGTLDSMDTDYAGAITGIAGPEGGTPEKPVGTVYLGVQGRNKEAKVIRLNLPLDRDRVREYSANLALFNLYTYIRKHEP